MRPPNNPDSEEQAKAIRAHLRRAHGIHRAVYDRFDLIEAHNVHVEAHRREAAERKIRKLTDRLRRAE